MTQHYRLEGIDGLGWPACGTPSWFMLVSKRRRVTCGRCRRTKPYRRRSSHAKEKS